MYMHKFGAESRQSVSIHPIKEKKSVDYKESEIELHPDAWARFERAVDLVIKSPKPRELAQPATAQGEAQRRRREKERKERPASNGRIHKGKSRA
jgi:hypothetical protein